MTTGGGDSRSIPLMRNYAGGQWLDLGGRACLDVENPSTGKPLARVPLSIGADVDRAVEAAAAAFPAWSRTPVSARVQPLFRLAQLLRDKVEPLARTITAEMGKSLGDARVELKRTIENVETACGMPTLLQGEHIVGCAADIDGTVMRVPLGVFGMIAPFNFPSMVPFWFLPYAVAAGNTYVVKCSERVPMTMQAQFDLMAACGFPPGVVNLVNGDREAASALLKHPKVAGISFVGSSAVARQVACECAAAGKRCQALGSAKNYLVVMPDARMDEVVRNMLTSCFGCAGQRCMAASVIACVGSDVYDRVATRLVAAARSITVGDPLTSACGDDDLLVGPVISARARDRIESLIQTGIDEGAELLLDGRGVRVPGGEGGSFIGPTVLGRVRPGQALERTEIFGPVVILMEFATLDDAIAAINAHEYGNGASIYTQNGYHARRFKIEARVGMVGINVGIPAPVAHLPFGGTKASMWGDIKGQGREVVNFFTDRKIITERFWPEI